MLAAKGLITETLLEILVHTPFEGYHYSGADSTNLNRLEKHNFDAFETTVNGWELPKPELIAFIEKVKGHVK